MSRSSRVLTLLGFPADKISADCGNSGLNEAIAACPAHAYLLPTKEAQVAELNSWLALTVQMELKKTDESIIKDHCLRINEFLLSKTYLVGESLTLADVCAFDCLMTVGQCFAFPNIARYLRHIIYRIKGSTSALYPDTIGMLTSSSAAIAPTVFPVFKAAVPVTAAAPADAAAKDGKADAGKVDDKKPDKKADKKEKAKAEAKPAEAAPLDPTRLDIRVGVITKCWNHPDSEKLLCEEVDVGDGAGPDGQPIVRSIASGIREFYSAEDMVGRHVVVLCNLKERSIAGFKSQGMVMCAVAPEHKDVQLLSPRGMDGLSPTTAKVQVLFPGFNAANEPPMQPNQVAKKKIFENLVPNFFASEDGVATWNGTPFTLSNGSVVGVAKGVDNSLGRYQIS